MLKGNIKLIGLIESCCFSSVQELIKALPNLLMAEFPEGLTNVTVGNKQPSEEERDNLWIRKDNSGSFIGIYVFSQGVWRCIEPLKGGVKWVHGDSRDIEQGYSLIDTGLVGFTADEITHIKHQYFLHSSGTYYTYFAVTFTGF